MLTSFSVARHQRKELRVVGGTENMSESINCNCWLHVRRESATVGCSSRSEQAMAGLRL